MSTRDNLDLLLEAPDPTAASTARSILEAAGIPSLLHGYNDAHHDSITDILGQRPDLLVPHGARQRALDLLVAAGFFTEAESAEGRTGK